MLKVIKKDGTAEEFNVQKVVVAVNKSAYRVLVKFTEEELQDICRFVEEKVKEMGVDEVHIPQMHNIVEGALERVNPLVAKSYRDYRNYKQDFVQMLDEVYKKSQSIMYIGDKENSNTDSALVSTKRSLIFNELNKELYKKFFLTVEEIQAIARFAASLPGVNKIHLLPYHRLGQDKYEGLGRAYLMDGILPPDGEKMKTLKRAAESITSLHVQIGG